MKQVININFQGRVIPIEVLAYERLKKYIESLNRHFAEEEGRDEIINDIENRIGELFYEKISQGATCITEEHVQGVINSMGNPEDFDDAHSAEQAAQHAFNKEEQQQQFTGFNNPKKLYRNENDRILGGVCGGLAVYFGIDAVLVRIIFVILSLSFGFAILPYLLLWIFVPSSATQVIGAQRKRLYRSPDDKIIAGVCSGLGYYFGINAWIPRALFILPFLGFAIHNIAFFNHIISLSFSPGAVLVYVILWAVLPEAITTAEKLEMKGEKVDLNSIKNSVAQEMREFQERAGKLGKEMQEKAKNTGQIMNEDIRAFTNRNKHSIGNVISKIIKVFAYAILGTISIVLIAVFFALGIAAISVFPLKAFLVTDGWQNVLTWATLILFIIVPILAVIIWTIRRLVRAKKSNKVLSYSFGILWTMGWVCFFLLIALVGRDFKSSSSLRNQEVELTNPSSDKLIVTSTNPFNTSYYRHNMIRMIPFSSLDEDTLYLNNVRINIFKSPDTLFHVSLLKMANGYSKRNANSIAENIDYPISQFDSLLVANRGVPFTKKDKFRNQRILLNVYVPIGKQIKVEGNIENEFQVHIGFNYDEDDDNYLEVIGAEQDWERGVNYIMTADGLFTLDGDRVSKHRFNSRGWMRGDDKKNNSHVDEPELFFEKNRDKIRDSLKNLKQEIEKQLDNFKKETGNKKGTEASFFTFFSRLT